MGCGASIPGKQAENDAAHPPKITKQGSKARDAQLKKINSQLGGKKIMNSFVVQKSRSRKRESDPGAEPSGGSVIKNAVEREVLAIPDEAPVNTGTGFHLPAETVAVSEPGLQGGGASSANLQGSGLSFKMARGSHANLLAAMKPEEKLVQVDVFRQKLYSEVESEIMEGVTYFREQLSVVNPPVAEIRATGVVPRLVVLLMRDNNRALQYEAAWTLTNIASADHDDAQDVCDQGAIPEFVRLIGSCDDVGVVEQAIWALGNIAADCKELQKWVVEEEVVPPLLAAMRRHTRNPSLLRHAVWLLSNLCRPRPQSDDLFQAIPVLCSVVLEHEADTETVTHACWALAYLTGDQVGLDELLETADLGPASRAAADMGGTPSARSRPASAATSGVGSNVLPRLVDWVREGVSTMTPPSLRVLGNLCSGALQYTQVVVEAGGVEAMLSCLKLCGRMSVKKEVVWSLSNIAAGSSDQVAALLRAGVFPVVAGFMQSSEQLLQRECAFVLANPWSPTVAVTHDVAHALIQAGVVHALCSHLAISTPMAILTTVMEGLQDAIRKGQQMMMAGYGRQAVAERRAGAGTDVSGEGAEEGEGEAAPQPPPAFNPVVRVMKECDVMDRLQSLLTHADVAIHAKANGMKNMLQFMMD